jgi:hypothetical protein
VTVNTHLYLAVVQPGCEGKHTSLSSTGVKCLELQSTHPISFHRMYRHKFNFPWWSHAHNRPQGPKGVPDRLRSRIFLTFGTTRVLGRQPHAPATFTPRGNPWYSFLEAESAPGHMVPSVATEKIPSVTLGIFSVAQCLNHYATPGPSLVG